MRYLEHRGLSDTHPAAASGACLATAKWMSPNRSARLTLAARERLDNLTFIINCNLQRLDGPVRGNGQIIQELEALFTGAGWNVIKVLWGSDWDALFARDTHHALLRRFADDRRRAVPDAGRQRWRLQPGDTSSSSIRRLRALVAHMSLAEIDALKRGGHDMRKLYAAFAAARDHRGQPTVILAKTKKGYGMGGAGESRMTSHQQKKLDLEALRGLPRSLSAAAERRAGRERLPSSSPPRTARNHYLQPAAPRSAAICRCAARDAPAVAVPPLSQLRAFALRADGKEMSTTMAAVRLFSNLLRDKSLGARIVPIVADEARTFGMANLFRQIGIYSPAGSCTSPRTPARCCSYREARDGQLLEEGITEAGRAVVLGRRGDRLQRARPAHAAVLHLLLDVRFPARRRSDLGGGRSALARLSDRRDRRHAPRWAARACSIRTARAMLLAATVPNCRAYDPAFAGELAVILDHGARRCWSAATTCSITLP